MSENWLWEQHSLVAGACCPVPGCGALVISYQSTACLDEGTCTCFLGWDFTCPRCGTQFAPPRDNLIFQSVPKDWLLAGISHA
ncbi:MAG: hypothetical protein LAO56_13545 [Acidobacteriia bacterium]|nr:hypothetical protein [Terriglobia bacterium]